MSFWDSLLGAFRRSTFEFDGVSYPVFYGHEDFFDECLITGTAACGLSFSSYWTVLRAGHDKGVLDGEAKLICLGCEAPPPFSFTMALESDPHVSASCPRCGSSTGLILWNSTDCGFGRAIARGDLGTVKMLLDRGFAVDSVDDDGWTPLMRAANRGNAAIVQFLLTKGANPDYRNESNMAPLIAAMSVDTDLQAVTMLLDCNVHIDVQTTTGWTALMSAARWHHLEVVRDLLDRGASADLRNADKESALTIALASNVVPDIAELLIDRGANTNLKDKRGWTPLMLAVDRGFSGIVTKLLEKGADPNARSRKDRNNASALRTGGTRDQTALTIAAESARNGTGSPQIIDALLNSGADIDHRTENGWTALGIAVQLGQADIAMTLLQRGGAAGPDSKVGGSPLASAISREQATLANALIEHGADIDQPDGQGWTPLLQAARCGMTELAEQLLDRGASIDHRNTHGHSALGLAASRTDLAMFDLLISRGASVDPDDQHARDILLIAADRGLTEGVMRLLGSLADPEESADVTAKALRNAAYSNHLELVTALLRRGADIEGQDEDGNTLLVGAAYHGAEEVVSMLLNRGAAIDAQSNYGWTALIFASAQGHRDIAAMLIDGGADTDMTTGDGVTALINAAANGNTEIVELLLDAGASVDMATRDNWTALSHAASNGHTAIVSALLRRGAAVDPVTVHGYTPLMLAAENSHVDAGSRLLRGGANPNSQNNDGLSALMIAAARGVLVPALVDSGADLTMQDPQGRTAQDYAAAEGNDNIAMFLGKAIVGGTHADEPADAVVDKRPEPTGPIQREMLKTDSGAHGEYLKRLFDHIRAAHYSSSFGYDDLPAVPDAGGAPALLDGIDDAEVIEIGSDAQLAISPFLKQLKDSGFIESVGPSAFELTDIGRASSILLEGTDTSGYFVFDYNVMDTSYGRQAFEAIHAALGIVRGTCAFHDGDVTLFQVLEMAGNVARVEPADGREDEFSGGGSGRIGPYIAAMWTDSMGAFHHLHTELSQALGNAYVGHMTHGVTHRRDDFERAVSEQIMLTPAIEFIAGRMTPRTEKYLA